MSRVAIIDLGTNTFHILIAETNEGAFTKIFHQRIYAKLGEEGVETIGPNSYRRGIDALRVFNKVIDDHNVDVVKAIGTAALRKASNGNQFIEEVKSSYDIDVVVIDGLTEADYIYKGVRLALNEKIASSLIMDIGGGSVEFIISNGEKVQFIESYPVGLSPLHQVSNISDRAEPEEVARLHQWLVGQLQGLYEAIEKFRPKILVGSAGAFEVLVEMTGQDLASKKYFEIDKDQIESLYPKVLGSSKKEKETMGGLPRERIDYISAALVLIWHIIDAMDPQAILVSRYALKEGVLSEYLD